MSTVRKLIAVLAALLVGGCATRTAYESPMVPTSSKSQAPDWWRNFDDSRLDSLIERVKVNNTALRAAALRVRQAQLLARLSSNDRYPQLAAGMGARGSRDFKQGPTSKSQSAYVSVGYEAELWGRLGALRDAADWEAKATDQDREALGLALIGTTASLYFQLGYIADRLAMEEASVSVARRTLALVETQYTSGAASALEIAEARRTLQAQLAVQTQLFQLQTETRNALTVLLDGEDMTAFEATSPSLLTLPSIEVDVPASVLGRRPDLRAAESRLRASLASADATSLSFYPTLSLTAEAGAASSSLSNLLSNPVGTLAASLALPFVNVQRARLTTAAARTGYDAEVLDFQQTLQQALADVGNALSARTQYRKEFEYLDAALGNARTAERMYEIRYRSGAVALNDWLAAQEARRGAESAVLENRVRQLQNQVTLYQALGGDVET
ncbi:efflux transporter outer membrane subunit [Peristeroidobacter soli]|uniref:efflux transporter outer membrane subunit n=1 Tax=Peristeroidobacter soli TaxID=2497877 RepID=UPI00101DC51F|nr:efflux transporter outer membrane subunit [Peristeroidobacter soli]